MDEVLSGQGDGPAPRPADDPRATAIPDVHGHAKGEHKPYVEERPIPYSARMLFLWFYHAARRRRPRFMMVADHINYLTFEDPAAVNLVRRALKLAAAGDLYGAAETAGVDLIHAAVVSEGLRRGMRYSIGAEVDNDPRARPDAQNIVEAMKPDGLIRSVHFLQIEHPVHGAGWQWPFDNADFSAIYDLVGVERVWEIYMATLLEAIEKQPGHIVGHFYAPVKFGHWPDDEKLSAYEDQLVAACRERGMAIELNTRFAYRYIEDEEVRKRYFDANLRLLRKAKAQGVGIAVASDAHSPKDQGEGFDHVLELLDAAEINELVFPIGGRLARVALRAVREAAEEPEPERAPQAAATGEQADTEAAGAAEPRQPPKKRVRPSRSRAAERAAATLAEGAPEVASSQSSAPAESGRSSARSPVKERKPERKELAPKDAAPDAPARKATPRKEPREEARSKEGARKEATPKEAARTEPARKEPARKEPARKEPARKEPARKERARKEPARKEPARKEQPRKEPARKASTRKEPARKEPARKEPARKEPRGQSLRTAGGPKHASAKSKSPGDGKTKAGAGRKAAILQSPAKKVSGAAKARKTPAKPVRAPAKPKVQAKKKAAKPPAKPVKRAASKPPARKAAAKKAGAKKRPTKARR